MRAAALFVVALLEIAFLEAQVGHGAGGVTKSIFVDRKGSGDFTSIQAAIDSVPSDNDKWIRIHVKSGVYNEIVKIPRDKGFILLEGEGSRATSIESRPHMVVGQNTDHSRGATSFEDGATFATLADNVVVKNIAFKNTYVLPMKQALAAYVFGDMTSFYNCSFSGYQDTLADIAGRHYFHNCRIEGAMDFIFGAGQSIYENCIISTVKYVGSLRVGWITAQGREKQNDTNGFVFKYCYINGKGLAGLGRAWRPFSTVIFYKSYMSDIVVPEGYSSWHYEGREANMVYVEEQCQGPGSDTSRRVPWMKKLSPDKLLDSVSISYIDDEGWLRRQP